MNRADVPHVVGLLTFTENWVSGAWGYSTLPSTAHLWTISLEEQFYVLLPWLLARWLAASNSRHLDVGLSFLWGGFVLGRVVAVAAHARHPWIWTSLFCADSLLAGTWLGAREVTVRRPVARAACVGAGIVGLMAPGFLRPVDSLGAHQVVVYSFVAAGASMLCLGSLGSRALAPILTNRLIRYLGKISYGLYVYHLVAIAITTRVVTRLHTHSWFAFAAIALAQTLALAAVSYAALEKPFLRIKRRFEVVRTRPV
jgi:peptidoglycan/LPS O-acetylase OafA/YrhL